MRRPGPPGGRRADGGQAATEFLGLVPLLVLGVLAALQLTFAVTTVQATSAAARAGARAESRLPGSADGAAHRAVPSWLSGDLEVTTDSGPAHATVTVTLPVPLVLPGVDGLTVTRRATFEPEHGLTPWE